MKNKFFITFLTSVSLLFAISAISGCRCTPDNTSYVETEYQPMYQQPAPAYIPPPHPIFIPYNNGGGTHIHINKRTYIKRSYKMYKNKKYNKNRKY